MIKLTLMLKITSIKTLPLYQRCASCPAPLCIDQQWEVYSQLFLLCLFLACCLLIDSLIVHRIVNLPLIGDATTSQCIPRSFHVWCFSQGLLKCTKVENFDLFIVTYCRVCHCRFMLVYFHLFKTDILHGSQ